MFRARAPRDDVSPRAQDRRASGVGRPEPTAEARLGWTCLLQTREGTPQIPAVAASADASCRQGHSSFRMRGVVCQEEPRIFQVRKLEISPPRSRDSTSVGWPQRSPSREAAGAAAGGEKAPAGRRAGWGEDVLLLPGFHLSGVSHPSTRTKATRFVSHETAP